MEQRSSIVILQFLRHVGLKNETHLSLLSYLKVLNFLLKNVMQIENT